jgi:hypothetical protein
MAGRPQVDLRKLFKSLEAEMCAALDTKRRHLVHAGLKGDATEAQWSAWLQDYLPTRYRVQHRAQIVDVDGHVSEAQDVVIFDRQYTPFLFNQNGHVYIPAEGVYAVFEAKQELSAAFVRYAGGKAASARQLRRTSAPIRHAGGKFKAIKPPRILAGVLTLDSTWAKGRWIAPTKAALAKLESGQWLDIVCLLREGTATVAYGRRGTRLTTSTESLNFLFLSLLAGLQSMGTVPAIDFEAYRRAIPTKRA